MKPILYTITLLTGFLFLSNSPARSQAWASHHGMTAAVYQSKFDEYAGKGYRLRDVDGYSVNGTPYFAAIWEMNVGITWAAHHNMTAAVYQQKFDEYAKQGYRPVMVDGYANGNAINFVAVWEKTSGPAWVAHHNMSAADYQAKFNTYQQQGYRLKWVSGYALGNDVYFAAIWDKSVGSLWIAKHNMTAAVYQSTFNDLVGQGYRPTLVSAYNVGNTDYYAAIWERKSGSAWVARHRMTGMGYQNEFDNQLYTGFKPVNVSGYARDGKANFAAIWESTGLWKDEDRNHIDKTIGDFMRNNSVPGAAIALVKDGRLVYAKGYGNMDRSTGEVPGPNTLFRIASVSKPITAVAVMKQLEANKYKIGDKVFGSGALLGTTYGANAYSDNEKAITVQHLLEHTAGGNTWNNKGDDGTGDPMFQQTGYNHAQLIGWVLDNREPETAPGTKSDYSNFGFCVLGRIIEKYSGQTYENYVRENVLKPCGISDMYIGSDDLAGRRYNEAVYYDGDDPYGMKVKRMDSHGGWIASPLDLVKLLVRADGFSTKPDIISASSFTTMTTPCLKDKNYAKGWAVNGSNYYHNGSLPGTGAIIVRTGSGMCWALVMNTRWIGAADGMMWEVVNGISNWPAADLF